MRSFFPTIVLAVVACSPITPFRADGGVDGGFAAGESAGGSSSTSGGGALAGGTGGGSMAGGSSSTSGGGALAGGTSGGAIAGGTSTAGGSATADAGVFSWAPVSVPSTVAVRSIHGKGNDVFATTFSGPLLAATTPTSLDVIPGFTHVDADDVYVTPSLKVVVTGNMNWSYVCESGNCRQGANYVARSNTQPTDAFLGLCGFDETVFAVGVGTSIPGILFEYTPSGFVRRSASLGIGNVRNCVVLPSGLVRVAGMSGVAVYDGGFAVETPGPSRTVDWQFLAFGSETNGLIVGSDSVGVAARFDTNSWRMLSNVPAVRQFEGVVALSATEYLVIATETLGQPMVAFLYDGAFRRVALPADVRDVVAAHSPTSRSLYLLGVQGSGRRVVYLGTR